MFYIQRKVDVEVSYLVLTCHHPIEDQEGETRGAGSQSQQGNDISKYVISHGCSCLPVHLYSILTMHDSLSIFALFLSSPSGHLSPCLLLPTHQLQPHP